MLGDTGLDANAHVIIEKPFGTDLGLGQSAEPDGPRRLRRVPGVPHRPLPRQGVGGQHPRLPLRERAVRAHLEPRAHPLRADRRTRDAHDRGASRASTNGTGAFRDMVVTHLLQVLGFVAMEPPNSLSAKSLRDEKIKVFDAMTADRRRAGRPRPVHGLPRRAGRLPDLARRRPSSPSRSRWTTGAGPACRSTCAPARRWPRAGRSSRSACTNRRCGCSRRHPGRRLRAGERDRHRLRRPGLDRGAVPGQGARPGHAASGTRR